MLGSVADAMADPAFLFDGGGRLVHANRAARVLLGHTEETPLGRPFAELVELPAPSDGSPALAVESLDTTIVRADGARVPVRFTGSALPGGEERGTGDSAFLCVAVDRSTEGARPPAGAPREAQRLETVGRLAAGVVHELNTPIQVVGDSLAFLDDAFGDIAALLELCAALPSVPEPKRAELIAKIEAGEEDADLLFLADEVPQAIARGIEGARRVADSVRAVREFAQPSPQWRGDDLNAAVLSALTLAHTEYRYVADVELALGDLPPVPCLAGDVRLAVLELVVHAARAIEAAVGASGARGKIQVSTAHEDEHVRLTISDNGADTHDPGCPSAGLSIVRDVVVGRHGGELSCETRASGGTTFHVRLPLDKEATRAV